MNTIAPVFAVETPEQKSAVRDQESHPELLYVLNLVRTKKDQSVRRYVALCGIYTISYIDAVTEVE